MKRAKSWGHASHWPSQIMAVVQAFPDASHALDKGDSFKILYGVEGYLVDDMKELVEHSRGQSFSDSYVVFDIETTGFSPEKNKIIEIGAVKVVNGQITDKFSTFVNPDVPIPFRNRAADRNQRRIWCLSSPGIEVILPQFLEFCKDCAPWLPTMLPLMSALSPGRTADGRDCRARPTVLDTVADGHDVLLPQLEPFQAGYGSQGT